MTTGEVWTFDAAGPPAERDGSRPDRDTGTGGRGRRSSGPPGQQERPPERSACGSYRAGHDPHVIQHRLCSEETDPVKAARLVEVTEIDDRGWIEFELDGEVHRRWNHHPNRLRHVLDEHPDALVEVSLRWHLLKVYRHDLQSAWVFNLGNARSSCRSD